MGFLNMLTAPLGIKFEKGGPYPDAGYGDKQEAATAQFMAQLAPLIAQIAEAAGVVNPLKPAGDGAVPTTDAYGLSATQQGEVNRQASVDRAGYEQILQRVKANLAARGMSDMLPSAEAYLSQQLQGQLSSNRVTAGQNAYNTKMNAIQSIGQLLGQGYGAQMGTLESGKQLALQKTQQASSALGNALAMGLYAGGVGPFGAPKTGTPPIVDPTNSQNAQGFHYGVNLLSDFPAQQGPTSWFDPNFPNMNIFSMINGG